jgi:SpoVK/Ycf46/Vps4 family AAA+-type ATPase
MTKKTPKPRTIQTISRQILQYLDDHPRASDTVEGILDWWLSVENQAADLDAVKASLRYLEEQGEVEKVELGASGVVYQKSHGSKNSVSVPNRKYLKSIRSDKEKFRLAPETSKQLHSLVTQFKKGNGHVALFADSSGTGKTMAAEFLDREYGMQIYKVDLAAVVSKYIGETEKNLTELFDSARDKDTVLMFDEAESLFGKRTDVSSANDRYANLETNFLLQQIESHPGLVILTTNQADQIDDTLRRRVSWSIEAALSDLNPGDTVDVDGLGDAFSGQYYVDGAQHNISETDYQEELNVERNDTGDK